MGISVTVNPPKTPVTEGSNDVAPSSIPGVYKMPGPPAPFVPTPLPNIGKSSDNLSCTKTVKIEDSKVANKGTTYKSTGSPDAASKGTGGGVVSSTEEGTTEFTAPGSMNVKAEGENVQLLGDAMTNDDKDGGATLPGNIQSPGAALGISEEDGDAICKAFCQAWAEYKDMVKNDSVPETGYSTTARFRELLMQQNIPGLATEPSYLVAAAAEGGAELLTPSVFAQVGGFIAEAAPEIATRLGPLLAGGAAADAACGGSVEISAGVTLGYVLVNAGRFLSNIKGLFGVGPGFMGTVTRPDVTITRDGVTKALEAKFPTDKQSKADRERAARQEKNFKKIDDEGKYREINCEKCRCC
jgi:hypothetical protein